jgi:hypothetical protein
MAEQLYNKQFAASLGLSSQPKARIKGTTGYKLSWKCLCKRPIKCNIYPCYVGQLGSVYPTIDFANGKVTQNKLRA